MRTIFLMIIACCCIGCAQQTEEIQYQTGFQSSSNVGVNEKYAHYKNATILFEEEKSGDDSFYIQEISHQKEDVVFTMRKIPTPLYVKREKPAMPESELTTALKELENEQVFYFEIEEIMSQDILKKYHEEDMEKAVSYFAFDIQNDFWLYTADGDTLKPSFTLYERNFHVAPFERIIIDFNGLKQGESFDLVYKDRMFGKGEMTFSFPDEKFVSTNVKELL